MRPRNVDNLYYCSDKDREDYNHITRDLPASLPSEPSHCGPWNLYSFRELVTYVWPLSVLEIGFRLGHSASIWINQGVRQITSIDIYRDERVDASVALLKSQLGDGFEFIHADSKNVTLPTSYKPDLIFIDGGHQLDDVRADIALGLRQNCTQFFFDDWHPHFGDVQLAVEESCLVTRAIWGNMAYCVVPEAHGLRVT